MMVCLYASVGYIHMFSKYASPAFIYDSNFAQSDHTECCGAIIYDRSHALVSVL